MVVVAHWPAPAIKQVWSFAIGKNCIDIDVTVIPERDIELKNVWIGVSLKKRYEEWAHYSGGVDVSKSGGEYPPSQKRILGLAVIKGFEESVSFPALGFDVRASAEADCGLLKKITFHLYEKHPLLLYSSLSGTVALRKGAHCLFSGRISFFNNNSELDHFLKQLRKEREISRGPLKVFLTMVPAAYSGRGRS